MEEEEKIRIILTLSIEKGWEQFRKDVIDNESFTTMELELFESIFTAGMMYGFNHVNEVKEQIKQETS